MRRVVPALLLLLLAAAAQAENAPKHASLALGSKLPPLDMQQAQEVRRGYLCAWDLEHGL